MATIDYSVGFTTREILDILNAQKAELKKTLAAYGNDGSNVTKRRIDEIHEIIAACQSALKKRHPNRYDKTVCKTETGMVGYLEK